MGMIQPEFATRSPTCGQQEFPSTDGHSFKLTKVSRKLDQRRTMSSLGFHMVDHKPIGRNIGVQA